MAQPQNRLLDPSEVTPIEDLTVEEAKVAAAQARLSFPPDDDFETLLANTLRHVEDNARAQRERLAERITALEARISGA